MLLQSFDGQRLVSTKPIILYKLNNLIQSDSYGMTRIGNAYRWIHAHLTTRPTNYSWVIKDKLAGSGIPVTYSQFLWVLAHGIKTIITVISNCSREGAP